MLKSFIITVSVCSLLISCIVPVSVSFTFPMISSPIQGHTKYHQRLHGVRRVSCSMNTKILVSNIHDTLDEDTDTDTDGGRSNEAHFHLLEKVDTILNTKMDNLIQKKEETLASIDASHAKDVEFCASLGSEASVIRDGDGDPAAAVPIQIPIPIPIPIPAYEWVHANDEHSDGGPSKRPLAIRTIDPKQPILDQESISIIREAAQKMWEASRAEEQVASQSMSDSKSQSTHTRTGTTSRFTYQRKGNYEAHLVDLADKVDGRIRTIIMDTLGQRIYPLVRDAFRPLIADLDELDLRIYDSLVIRYNSTEAMMVDPNTNIESSTKSFLGAGQPLHRDLGIVSVNIMLNAAEEFQGGGTMFENQLRSAITEGSGDAPLALKPIGAGHAIAHLSNERHAGVGTTSGVRDILVLFLTASRKSSTLNVESTGTIPYMERATRLKTNARPNCIKCETLEESILCRMMYRRLALQFVPTDGEAWHYLGMSLREHAKTEKEPLALEIMQLSISCLEQAVKLTPCDGRLCNNLGLAFETLSEYATATDKTNICGQEDRATYYYKRSVQIHALCEKVGCDVSFDFAMVTLNYGLYIANQDKFDDAVKILSRLRRGGKDVKSVDNPEQDRIINDGLRLLNFCEGRI